MTDKHTPGPWSVVESSINEGSYDYFVTTPQGALGYGPWPHKHPDPYLRLTKANARLIAAAPDMLAALQWISEWHERYSDDEPAAIEAARAAIAKATEETS